MSRERKIVLAVFASLAGLVILAAAATAVLLPRLLAKTVAASADPRSTATIARKIARFRVPSGYHFGRGFDVGFSRLVTIVPDMPHAPFVIELQSFAIASGDDASLLSGTDVGLRIAGSCSSFEDGRSVVLRTALGRPLALTVKRCANPKTPFLEEGAAVPGLAQRTVLIAVGSVAGFDENAVRTLVRSLRR